MELFIAGINHRTAPVALREQLAVAGDRVPALLAHLLSRTGLAEAVVVNTCNRLEIYATSARRLTASALLDALAPFCHAGDALERAAAAEALYWHEGIDCVRHLFRVASSLDSLVVGETEIVGQIKKAYQIAQSGKAVGKILHRLFQKAFSVSKEVRTRSGIGRCSTSVGSVAVDLSMQIFGDDLSGQKVLIVGAGKMSETTLKHLSKRGQIQVLVANRSEDRARQLAGEFGGRAVPLSKLAEAVSEADIVISSTSAPGFIITERDAERAMELRRNKPLFLIDLAVPRDIDPRVLRIPGVYLYDIDQLSELAQVNRQRRQEEAFACEVLVSEAAEEAAGLLNRVPSRHGCRETFRFPECVPLLRQTWAAQYLAGMAV